MAPSFSLFNQSFDSLGDTAQYLNVSEPLEGAFRFVSSLELVLAVAETTMKSPNSFLILHKPGLLLLVTASLALPQVEISRSG
jgi:hypothetical protein